MKRLSLFLLLSFMLSLGAFAQYQVERMAPPFWWAGMEHPTLQIMVYGEDLSALRPSIDYPGVTLEKATMVKSPNYLFLQLDIAQAAKPGTMEIRFAKDGKTVLTQDYELRERNLSAETHEGFDVSDVIYLITPDRFANGNPDNDEVEGMMEKLNRDFKGGRHGGDIQGIIDNLGYIDDLGFTAIWLNPVTENNMKEYSYHGYSTTDFYKVDPRFGSNQEYRKMIQEADKRGIKVIMDMIHNHCGSYHWWMDDLPTDDWINYDGQFVQTNHRREVHQDPYVSDYDHKRMLDGWFVETMPDLNQNNPLMAEFLIQNSIWWIEYSGITGIRMDTYPYPEAGYMTDWTCRIMKEYPRFNIVGEEWSINPAVVAHWQQGKKNPNGYTSCLRSVMDFPVQHALVEAMNNEQNQWSGLTSLYEMMSNDFIYADPSELVIMPDNHDMSRFYTQVGHDYSKFINGMAFILTTRGIPQIYYGTEILMKNPGTNDHGIIRSDFPGGWKGDKKNGFTGKNLEDDQKQAKAFFRNLINWRNGKEVIHNGKLKHFVPHNGAYVFFRYNDNEKVMVVINRNEDDTALKLGRYAEMLDGVSSGKDVISGNTYKLGEELQLPAGKPLVLELN